MKRRSADRYGVIQWFADGRRAGTVPNPRITVAVAIPVLLAAAVVAVALPGKSAPHGKPELAGAIALARHHQVPLPMPTASAPAGSDCGIVVPPNPLSAKGLATPYRLTGSGCTMIDSGLRAFVQATIFDPVTAKLSVYEPLVIDQGTAPAVAPARPRLPRGAVVTIDFGFNGDNLTQVASGTGGNSLKEGRCVNGLPGSNFGQVSYCNGPAFYQAAKKAISAGSLKLPPLGTGKDGRPCPTTRSFTMVDQDQSDNVTTRYLLTPDGRTAQDTPANAATLSAATVITNGSDDALLDSFLDPALGCSPLTAPDLSNSGASGTSQALNELQAWAQQGVPRAYVPVNDPMTEVNGSFSRTKTNLYRAGVGQFGIPAGVDLRRNALNYCRGITRIQVASLQRDKSLFLTQPPADPTVGDNLFTFMAARLSGSFDNLGCGSFGLANPVHLKLDANGVAIDATFGSAASPSPSTTASSASTRTAAASATPASATPAPAAASGAAAPGPSSPAGSATTPNPSATP